MLLNKNPWSNYTLDWPKHTYLQLLYVLYIESGFIETVSSSTSHKKLRIYNLDLRSYGQLLSLFYKKE